MTSPTPTPLTRTIRCPHCGHAIALAQPRPGRYRPTCPTCRTIFQLTIDADPTIAPRATAISSTALAAPTSDVPATIARAPIGSPEQIAIVTSAAERWAAAPYATVRKRALQAFGILVALLAAAGALAGSASTVVAAIAVGIVGTLAYQLIVGIRSHTPLLDRVLRWTRSAGLTDWLTVLGVALVLGIVVGVFGWIGVWIYASVFAILLAVAFHVLIDPVLAVQREGPLADVDRLVKSLRDAGVEDTAIRSFVARYAGRRWAELHEAVFGYDAMRAQPVDSLDRSQRRGWSWRDAIIDAIDRSLAHRAMPQPAVPEASAAATASVATSPVPAGVTATTPMPTTVIVETPGKPPIAESLEGWRRQSYLRRRYGGPIDLLLGRRMRFLLAALILIGAGLWVRQNSLATLAEDLRAMRSDAERGISRIETAGRQVAQPYIDPTSQPATELAVTQPSDWVASSYASSARPLRVRHVPTGVADAVGSWSGLAMGLLLLLSCLPRGHLMSIVVLGCAAYGLFGHLWPLPALGPPARWFTALVAILVALPSMFFLRDTRG